MKNNFNKKINKGFTVLETLVAVMIFTVSITALMSLSTSSQGQVLASKNKLVASYLAQEGIELVRNARDTYILDFPNNPNVSGWSLFLSNYVPACSTDGGCNIIPTDIDLVGTPCPMGPMNGCALYYDASTGLYDTTSNAGKAYYRAIKIEHMNTSGIDEVKVTSTVSWVDGGTNKNISYVEFLNQWPYAFSAHP